MTAKGKLKPILIFAVIAALLFAAFAGSYRTVMKLSYPHKYEEFVEKYSAEFGLDSALLFESDLACLCGKTVCITADDSVRMRRIIERDGLSETDALMRIAAQPPQEFYAKQSDIIIDNGDGTDLRKAIDCLF